MKKLLFILLLSALSALGQSQQLYSVKVPQNYTYSTGKPQYIDRYVNPVSGALGIWGFGTDTVPVRWALGPGITVTNGTLDVTGGGLGNVVGPASATNNALAQFDGVTGKLLKSPTDLTYTTPTLSVPDAFAISSAGSIALTAGGVAKNVTATPSTTGSFVVGGGSGASSINPASGNLLSLGTVGTLPVTNISGGLSNSTTTAAGSAFTNQPSNDGVEVLSANAGDTTQTVTIIGTTTGGNTVVVETVTLNGTTFVPTVKTNWGVILAVKKSATTLGTVTVRKATGDATITAGLTAAMLSVGVNLVSPSQAYNQYVFAVASGGTTKQIGFQGTNAAGTVIYDSVPLTGATQTGTSSQFLTLTEIYTGDVEVTRTATVSADGSTSFNGSTLVINRNGTVPNVVQAASNAQTGIRIFGAGAAQSSLIFHGFQANPVINLYNANGTAASPTASTVASGALARFGGGGWNGTIYRVNAEFVVMPLETWSATANGSSLIFRTTAATTTSRIDAFTMTSDTSSNAVLTGPAGNMTIIAGTGNSRTLTLQSTTSGGTATNAVVFSATQSATFNGPIIRKVSTLTYASPTSVDVTLANVYTVTTVNATGSVTFNASAGGTAGQGMTILITNDATSAKTITFGTNFLTTGTLTASAVSRHTSISFTSDGTSWYETGRAVMSN